MLKFVDKEGDKGYNLMEKRRIFMKNVMKVKDFPYKRYEADSLKKAFEEFKNIATSADNAKDIADAYRKFIDEAEDYMTMASLAYTRYTLNTHDEFYLGEQDYYDEVGPVLGMLFTDAGKLLLDSPYRDELSKMFPETLFMNLECDRKAHSEAAVADEQEENSIVTEYSQLMSQIGVDWNGEKKPISYVRGFMEDGDREVRRKACEAIGLALQGEREKLDDIYDRLVKVRTRIARKMGYKNFVELGYYRMGRIDYNEEMVKTFRKNVLTDLVPVVCKLKEKIAKNLGIDKFMFYDNDVIDGGDPRPYPDAEGILKAAQEMYHEMEPSIGEFMDRMLAAEAFDTLARDGKWGGGYATTFPNYKQPFILANFNGSSGDVDVVTHEFGHTVAMDYSMRIGDNTVGIGSSETAETHSMSMEFLSWPYMDKFFKDPALYEYKHLASSLSFIPYGVIVDEFQHIVYENPDMTPAERDKAYLELEKKYRPYLSYEGIPYLELGTRWQYQMHIYESPFYYIDYCLAQVVALEFLVLSRKDYKKALETYIAHAKRGGTHAFRTLVELTGLKSPFAEGALKEVAEECTKILDELHK